MLQQRFATAVNKPPLARRLADMKEQTIYMKNCRNALGSALDEVQALKGELRRHKSNTMGADVLESPMMPLSEKNSHLVVEISCVTHTAATKLDRIKTSMSKKNKLCSNLAAQLRVFAKALVQRDKKLAEKIELNKELNSKVRHLETSLRKSNSEIRAYKARLADSQRVLLSRDREIINRGREISNLDRNVWSLTRRLQQVESHLDQSKQSNALCVRCENRLKLEPNVDSVGTNREKHGFNISIANQPWISTHKPHNYPPPVSHGQRYHHSNRSPRKPWQLLSPICEEENSRNDEHAADCDVTGQVKPDNVLFTTDAVQSSSSCNEVKHRKENKPPTSITTTGTIESQQSTTTNRFDETNVTVAKCTFPYLVVDQNKIQQKTPNDTQPSTRSEPYLIISTQQNLNNTLSSATWNDGLPKCVSTPQNVPCSTSYQNTQSENPTSAQPFHSPPRQPSCTLQQPRTPSPTPSSVTTEDNSDPGTPSCSSDSGTPRVTKSKTSRPKSKRATSRSRKYVHFRGHRIDVTSFSMQEFREIMWSTCADDNSADEFLNFLSSEAGRLNLDPVMCNKHTLGQPADWLSLKGCY
ncbi:uncharacterized protein LOC100178447 [Ciona intestinalis]